MSSLNGFKIDENGNFAETKLTFTGHKLCGSGRFSNVYLTKLIVPTKKDVAIKNVWSDHEMSGTKTSEYVEVQILKKLYHPAIANLLYFYSRNSDGKIIHCLILDFLPFDMGKLKEKGYKFDVLDAKIYTFQLFCAIAYLSSKNIVHMDIKPQNIIMNKDEGFLKLADFGNARRLDSDERTGNPYQVTRFYRPPELLFGCEKFTTAIDLWSVGCVAFEFFANRTLFKGKDTKEQISLIINVFGYPTDEDVKSMGVKRPRVSRKTARGIETFTSNTLDGVIYDLLKAVLVLNPKNRKLGEEVLKLPIFDVLKMEPPTLRSNGKPIPDLAYYSNMKHSRMEEGSEKSKESSEEND